MWTSRANDIDVRWSARKVLKKLKRDGSAADLAGMNELNERVQIA